MLRLTQWAVFAGLLLICGTAAAADSPPSKTGDWTPLFNGKDLTGWEMVGGAKESWKVEDGVLYCTGGGGGWLSTKEQYDNFELELEFRVPKGGNSGVFLRSPHQGDPAYTGMEIQVLDDAAKEYAKLQAWQYCGSVYGVAAPAKRVTKPAGEWQTMRIVCDKRQVKIAINGAEIINTNLDEHKDKYKSHPGLERSTGYIGLQNHGSRLDYRNVRLKKL